MVKDLTKEQNQFASYEDQLKAEAQEAEVDLYANPLATYNPQSLQTKAVAPQDFSQDEMIYQLSRDANNASWLAPIPVKQLDNRSALTRFGSALMVGVIDTGGLALQGIAETVAAGTATDDDYKNFFEKFASGKDSSLWRAGQAIRDGNREIFGEVDLSDDKIADDLGYVFGNLGGFIGVGVAGTAVGGPIAGLGMMATLGGGMAAADMAERARSLGYDEYDIEFNEECSVNIDSMKKIDKEGDSGNKFEEKVFY